MGVQCGWQLRRRWCMVSIEVGVVRVTGAIVSWCDGHTAMVAVGPRRRGLACWWG